MITFKRVTIINHGAGIGLISRICFSEGLITVVTSSISHGMERHSNSIKIIYDNDLRIVVYEFHQCFFDNVYSS